MRLKGRTALITGVASEKGIGRAVARAFAREGAAVACVDCDGPPCQKLAEELERGGVRALALEAEVADAAQVAQAVATASERLGPIDVLVNNAGFAQFIPFLEVSETQWDRALAVNLKGYFLFAQEVARRMVAQGTKGAIVNVSSISAWLPGEQKVPYCVSKAGVAMLTKGMALELARQGIRVNAVAPGDIDTNIVRDPHTQEFIRTSDLASLVPLGRRGKADEVAEAVVFLASAEAAYITGAQIVVDGGLTLNSTRPPAKKD